MGKKIFVIIILALVVFWVFKFWTSEVEIFRTSEVEEVLTSDVQEIKIKNIPLNIQLADSPAERVLGLSGRDDLADDEGLLFIFNSSGFYNFWMKDMRFPIDIIWVGEDWRVVDLKTAVSPATYPELFTSRQLAKYVLEVNSGWVNKNNIQIGDVVK